MEINLIRHHDGLRPSLPEDADKLAKIKAGTIIACSKCLEEKVDSEFSKDANRKTGRHPQCKACHASYARGWYLRNRTLTRERVKQNRLDNLEDRRAYGREWNKKNQANQNRKERKARNALNHAIRKGRLKRNPCERCGEKKTQGHHEDYSKPLDVVWLCIDCHGERHREINDEKDARLD